MPARESVLLPLLAVFVFVIGAVLPATSAAQEPDGEDDAGPETGSEEVPEPLQEPGPAVSVVGEIAINAEFPSPRGSAWIEPVSWFRAGTAIGVYVICGQMGGNEPSRCIPTPGVEPFAFAFAYPFGGRHSIGLEMALNASRGDLGMRSAIALRGRPKRLPTILLSASVELLVSGEAFADWSGDTILPSFVLGFGYRAIPATPRERQPETPVRQDPGPEPETETEPIPEPVREPAVVEAEECVDRIAVAPVRGDAPAALVLEIGESAQRLVGAEAPAGLTGTLGIEARQAADGSVLLCMRLEHRCGSPVTEEREASRASAAPQARAMVRDVLRRAPPCPCPAPSTEAPGRQPDEEGPAPAAVPVPNGSPETVGEPAPPTRMVFESGVGSSFRGLVTMRQSWEARFLDTFGLGFSLSAVMWHPQFGWEGSFAETEPLRLSLHVPLCAWLSATGRMGLGWSGWFAFSFRSGLGLEVGPWSGVALSLGIDMQAPSTLNAEPNPSFGGFLGISFQLPMTRPAAPDTD
jgi:hypothetical protein